MLRSILYPDSGANSLTNVRIVAAPNLLKIAFYLENKIISDSYALSILRLVINAATNQLSQSQTQVSCYIALGKASFRFLVQLFDVSPATTYNWGRPAAESLDEAVIDEKS